MSMPDSAAKKHWMRENSKIISVKFMLKSDKDILDFLSERPTAPTIKTALREYMQNHPEGED